MTSDPFSDLIIANATQQIDAAYAAELAIANSCYGRLCERLKDVEYAQGTADEVVFALSARVLEMAAMSLRCMRSGSVASAKILMRAMLETIYKVCAIKNDPSNMDQFMQDDDASRLLHNKKILEYKKKKGRKTTAVGVEKKIDELVALKAKKIDPAAWAERAGMTGFHQLAYPWLSSDIHGNAAALNHHFNPERDHALDIGPTDADLEMTSKLYSRCLLAVLSTLEPNYSEVADWYGSMQKALATLDAAQ